VLMTILPEQGVLLSSRLRFRRSSSARPQHHVHISRSRFNQRGDSIQFNGFTAHDADENGAFVELRDSGFMDTIRSRSGSSGIATPDGGGGFLWPLPRNVPPSAAQP